MSFMIAGTGRCVPEYVLTNDELATMMDTSDEWISSRTGIKSRYICTTETMTDLTSGAAQRALDAAGLSAADLDLIICGTVQGDYVSPSQACLVQKRIGARCPAFDVNAACTGFLLGLDIAAGYFARGAQHILVIGAEHMSKHLNWNERSSCVLFGDGAGAAVLSRGDNLLSYIMTADGNDELIVIPTAPNESPFNKAPRVYDSFAFKGPDVYKFAVTSLTRDLQAAVDAAGLTWDDVDYVLPHQANKRIIETAAHKLGLPESKIFCRIEHYGNTSAGTVPMLLDELVRDGTIQRGDVLAMAAFGAGLTTAAAVVKY